MACGRLVQSSQYVAPCTFLRLQQGWLPLGRAAHQNAFESALLNTEQDLQLDFYDTTVEAFASKEIQTFSLAQVRLQMPQLMRRVTDGLSDPGDARPVGEEVKRALRHLDRRMPETTCTSR